MMINRAQIKKQKSYNPTENPRYSEPNESETLFRFLDAEEKKRGDGKYMVRIQIEAEFPKLVGNRGFQMEFGAEFPNFFR